jgi:hypothetical protein
MSIVTPLSSLPYMVFEPAWLEQAPAIYNPDARVFKAYVKVVMAAWRGDPSGSIPSSFSYLCEVTGLPMDVVEEAHAELTHGFELRDDRRLHHIRMSEQAHVLNERYGKELKEFAIASAMAAQEPDLFALVCPEGASSKAKGKQSMPRNFGYQLHPELRHWVADNGYPTEEDQEFVLNGFYLYVQDKGIKAKDWKATFKRYAITEIQWGRLPPSRQNRGAGRAGGGRPSFASLAQRASRGDEVASRNAERLSRFSRAEAAAQEEAS